MPSALAIYAIAAMLVLSMHAPLLVSGVLAVGGGGNGDGSKGPWNGGPEPQTLGLSFPAPFFQPRIDGTPLIDTAGSMGPVVDLSQDGVTGPGVYTSVGPMARTAKIYTYNAHSSSGGVGLQQTGMPTIYPREDPFFGALDFALSEDGDNTYRVAVKFNNYIKVIKFNGATNAIISEFRVNTLGFQDAKLQGANLHCNATCLPSHSCNAKVRGTSICTELWGLVAHANTAAVVIKVLERVWFQLYADDGTLLQNVNINLWGYPQSNILSETGKLKYGHAMFANYYSGGAFPHKVYFAFYHSSEGGCDHEGEQLILIDPLNWKACASGRLNWRTSTEYTDVAVALAWGGSHTFARRLINVKSGNAAVPGDIVSVTLSDYPYQRSPKYPGKGGIEFMGPHHGQIAPTYWFPDGYTQTILGDWVYPEGGWNGVADPFYYIVGSYAQQYCPNFPTTCGGFTAWLVVVRGDHAWSNGNEPTVYRKQMTADTPSNIDVIAVHLARVGVDRYLYAWTLRTINAVAPTKRLQNFMVIIDGLGDFKSPVEEVSDQFAWNHLTAFHSNAAGEVFWVNSWLQYPANSPTGNREGAPRYSRDYSEDIYNFRIVRMTGLASVDASASVSPRAASPSVSASASVSVISRSPSPTSSATPSSSPSASPSRSVTPTTSATPSVTRTASPTRSVTPTSSPSASSSPSSSATPSRTPSGSPSQVTQSPTPSVTPSMTTRSPSPTNTPTASRTPSATPTRTPSASRTAISASLTSSPAGAVGSGGGSSGGGSDVAIGIAVPVSLAAVAVIVAAMVYVIWKWRSRFSMPPTATFRRGSSRALGSPFHESLAERHVNDMYSPTGPGFQTL